MPLLVFMQLPHSSYEFEEFDSVGGLLSSIGHVCPDVLGKAVVDRLKNPRMIIFDHVTSKLGLAHQGALIRIGKVDRVQDAKAVSPPAYAG